MVWKTQLSKSEWITLLQNKRSNIKATLIPIYTLLLLTYLSLIQLNLSFGSDMFPATITEISFAIFFMFFIILGFIMYVTRPYSKLINKIIFDEITRHSDILKEYKSIQEKDSIKWKKGF